MGMGVFVIGCFILQVIFFLKLYKFFINEYYKQIFDMLRKEGFYVEK